MRNWNVGEDVEVGITGEDHQTIWVRGTVLKLHPFTVLFPDDTVQELPIHTIRRRPHKNLEDEPKKVSRELPAEALKELYHKALVDIIKEGNTKTPNATVTRIVNIAKEALGEIQI